MGRLEWTSKVGVWRSDKTRSKIAFSIAPLVGLYLYSAIMLAIELMFAPPKMNVDVIQHNTAEWIAELFATPLVYVVFGSPFAYFGMVVIGVPIYVVFRRYNIERFFTYGIAGFVGGAIIPVDKPLRSSIGVPTFLQYAFAGAVIMMVFWSIARKRRNSGHDINQPSDGRGSRTAAS